MDESTVRRLLAVAGVVAAIAHAVAPRALLSAGEARSLFSLDYLNDMNKAIPSDAEVTTELGEEFPVKMHFDFAEGDGHATFMLAPRIQSD